MCGIIGGWLPQSSQNSAPAFDVGLARLDHRGPNDRGLERLDCPGGEVVFGHTRLSIIDLSAAGHQPMHSRCGQYTLIFNGEIYNYRELRQELKSLGYHFVSDSDTEVLLVSWMAWGQKCLARLRGMFAFVIFDRVAGTLTSIRDAFGIKPFFYRLDSDGFLFASEVPALLALQPKCPPLNMQRVYDYLVPGSYDDCAETFFEGVLQLRPGHMLTLNLATGDSSITPQRWWWPSIVERTDLSFTDATEQLRAMFLNNVRLHLRSDVPLGAALSGGIDSSAVVCAIRHIEPAMPIHTFSYVARGSDLDEERWADLVNDHVGAVPHKVVVAADEFASDLDDMIRVQGEPFGSTSIYAQYRVFKLARDRGVTVTLDGQGADELLAGYAGYPGPAMHSLVEKGEFVDLLKFLLAWSQRPGHSVSQGVQALIGQVLPQSLRGLALEVLGRNPAPSWLNATFFKEQGVVPSLSIERKEFGDSSGRRLVAALRQASTSDGLNSLLRHGDRNAMRWSVESRVPFLTTDLAEFTLSLPEHYLISRQGESKHLFRAAMRGIVPDAILNRKDKVGFSTPEQEWLRQVGQKVFTWLDAAEALPFINANECKAEVKAMIAGHKTFTFQAWRLINFCRWSQLTGVL